FITHRFPFDKINDAFDCMHSATECLRCVISIGENFFVTPLGPQGPNTEPDPREQQKLFVLQAYPEFFKDFPKGPGDVPEGHRQQKFRELQK
uniref:Uncharacterized protein n=1 Tax=Meloidogyne javanica TaxID=6303 RepID=A0A915N0Z3_MELJA